MPGAEDQSAAPRPRLAPGEAAGRRRPGLAGWSGAVRRQLTARLRGEQDVSQLVREGMEVGRDVFIARGCYLDAGYAWLISIGDEATLGPYVTVLTHDAAPKLRTGYSLIARVHIGARAFIGANATILPGVTIGDDAIVGAGSVVRRDVQAGTVVLGNPAEEVGTTDQHADRHRAALAHRPRYLAADGERSSEDVRRIAADLEDGPGYVE